MLPGRAPASACPRSLPALRPTRSFPATGGAPARWGRDQAGSQGPGPAPGWGHRAQGGSASEQPSKGKHLKQAPAKKLSHHRPGGGAAGGGPGPVGPTETASSPLYSPTDDGIPGSPILPSRLCGPRSPSSRWAQPAPPRALHDLPCANGTSRRALRGPPHPQYPGQAVGPRDHATREPRAKPADRLPDWTPRPWSKETTGSSLG